MQAGDGRAGVRSSRTFEVQAQEIGGANGVNEYVGPQSRVHESNGAPATAGANGGEQWGRYPPKRTQDFPLQLNRRESRGVAENVVYDLDRCAVWG
jgi:hypothetical protein